MSHESAEQLEVLIAGGGVAGLEGALALTELAGPAVRTTLLTPEPEFVYRPMAVREPFGFRGASRYPLEEIVKDIGIELVPDSLERVDPEQRVIHTDAGRELSYDALLIGLGARLSERFKRVITIDDRCIDEQLHGLIQDVEEGYVDRVAFIAPTPMPWPLPLYELALMTARRAYDMNIELEITIATPEQAPLGVFGSAVSGEVMRLLEHHRIAIINSAHVEVERGRLVTIHPGGRSIEADRIVALPQLLGPDIPGLPRTSPDGFIPIDEQCGVRGLDRVWAAGDATDFPVKMGGIAAQQADTAAAAIASLAGVPVEQHPFEPEVHAILLGGRTPLYLSAYLTGGHGSTSELSKTPWPHPSKIAARHLAPYLETRDRVAGGTG